MKNKTKILIGVGIGVFIFGFIIGATAGFCGLIFFGVLIAP